MGEKSDSDHTDLTAVPGIITTIFISFFFAVLLFFWNNTSIRVPSLFTSAPAFPPPAPLPLLLTIKPVLKLQNPPLIRTSINGRGRTQSARIKSLHWHKQGNAASATCTCRDGGPWKSRPLPSPYTQARLQYIMHQLSTCP